uniref:Acyltransferase 3 domain-containing protein n=1 Tax=Noctiluca scintillans TaxID=2966 RepID=A0A7S1FAV0_NOCSC
MVPGVGGLKDHEMVNLLPVTQTPKDSGEVEKGSNERNALIDNSKFFLMWSIILIHSYEWPGHAATLQMFIDPFGTRAFCFVSGVVSRSPCSWRGLRRLFTGVVVPLLFFNTLVRPLGEHTGPETIPEFFEVTTTWMFPRFTAGDGLQHLHVTWYFYCLVLWRLLGYAMHHLPAGTKLGVAVVIGAVGGYLDTTWFALTWGLVSYPVFVAGQLFPLTTACEVIPWSPRTALFGVGILLALYFLTAIDIVNDFVGDVPNFGWVDSLSLSKWKYARPSCSIVEFLLLWNRGLLRNLLEMLKAMTLIVLCVPRWHCWVSDLGKNSVFPYLLHSVVIHLLQQVVPIVDRVTRHSVAGAVVLAFLLNVSLSSWPVRNVFCFILDPVWLDDLISRLCS